MEKDLAIAVDIGATNLRAGIVSKNGKILKRFETQTPKIKNRPNLLISTIIVLINSLLEHYDKKRILGIGAAVASPIDPKKGEIVTPPNLPYKEVPIVKPLKKYFSMPVIIANDCTAAVWAEKHFGAGKASKNFVYLTISSGIGAGIIADNHLLTGHNENAGEVGHFIVDTTYNLPCPCKKGTGHWEGYCSGSDMPFFLKIWLKSEKIKKKYAVKTSKDIFDLAKGKDKNILSFLKEIGKINARGISNIIVAYNPEIIIMGGAIVLNNHALIIPEIKKNIDKFLAPPKIIISPLKENACLLGAASLIFYPEK
ncbi:ROK family protein [Patescibacteria group bacterium]|nr:ROK family protein [Patescibacteria group bacterium]